MTIADYSIGLSSKTDNFNQRSKSRNASRRTRLTADEQEQRVWERRRRDWIKRQRGANRNHPARDREALSRLRFAAGSSDYEDAADIVQRLADCVARKSHCRLWICSRCASERSRQQVERLVGNLTDHGHSKLAAFTLILGATGLNGKLSAETAAAETRQEIERIRQHAKRAGVDIGYWGQVELKIVRTSELDETDHIAATLAEINPSSLEFSEILVPHVHGIARMGNASIGEVRQFFQKVYPASWQVVVKGLHDDQATDKALSVWGSYSTKSEIKTKRREQGKWFADMLSGQELMMVSIFQKALKYRAGRFSYHLQLSEVVGDNEFNERKYEDWLSLRCWVLRYRRRTFARDRLLDSYEAELASIHKRFWEERKSHYTIKTQESEMRKPENEQVHLTGQDEMIFSTVLFLMNLFLDEKNATRKDVDRAIHYFRDQGMPLDEELFNHILARWDTRLAWGTPARIVCFPLDKPDPAGGEPVIRRARRREMWKRMCEAIGRSTVVSAPPWRRNTPEFADLPSANAMLTVMADVCGTELLDRLAELTDSDPAHVDDTRTRQADPCIEAIFNKLRADPEIEVGFRRRRWLNLERL